MRRAFGLIILLTLASCTDFQVQEEDAPVPANFGVSVSEISFTSSPSTFTVKVSSGVKWDVGSMPSWISLSAINKAGSSVYEWNVSLTATANADYNRSGTISFKTAKETVEIPVSQEGEKGRYVAVESVSLSPTEMTMTEGETKELTATILPSNASDKSVTWSSSNTSVVTVSSSGVVSAISEGTASIMVKTNDGAKTSKCDVTVKSIFKGSGTQADPFNVTAAIAKAMETGQTATEQSYYIKGTVTGTPDVSAQYKNATFDIKDAEGGETFKVFRIKSFDGADFIGTESIKAGDVVVVYGQIVNYAGDTPELVQGGRLVSINGKTEFDSGGGPKAVDLGLSVKWASCNVGATTPEESGAYFAWGETVPKSNYDWSTYKWLGDRSILTKYNNVDNKSQLDLSDDAARANWGGNWRMPTLDECKELDSNCTWTWTTQNGKIGYLITSKKNGNSIFLPAAGYMEGTSVRDVDTYGFYWLSSRFENGDPYYALELNGFPGSFRASEAYRYFGQSIRPVTE